MKISTELMNQAKQATSVEELMALAQENGMTLSEEEAKKYFAQLRQEGALQDDELDNVAGGGFFCDEYVPRPERVAIGRSPVDNKAVCPQCLGGLTYGASQRDANGDSFDPASCFKCGLNFRHYWDGDEWTKP